MAKKADGQKLAEDHNNSFASLTSNKFGSIGETSAKSGNLQRQDDKAMMFASPVKSIPLIRQTGEAGLTEDKRITEFMQLIYIMESQRSNKKQDLSFRENYRKKSL